MEKNKKTFWTIIILLFIFVPITLYGSYIKFFSEENQKHQFYYEGQLWFYSGEKLLGTYKCKNTGCDYAAYQFNNIILKTNLIANKYAFIQDGNNIYLHDVINKWNIGYYSSLKFYKASEYLIQKDNKWGIVKVSDTVLSLLPLNYEEIKTIILKDDNYIVKKADNWLLIDAQENVLYSNPLEIEKFLNNLVVLKDETKYFLTDLKNNQFLKDEELEKIYLEEKFMITKQANLYYIYEYNIDNETNNYEFTVKSFFEDEEYENITYEEKDQILNIYANKKLIKTIELS